MLATKKIKKPLFFTVFYVLFSLIIPVTPLAADCPCFTHEDVRRYASHPAKFACVLPNGDQGVTRILVRGPYVAFFNIDTDTYESPDLHCSASVTVGDLTEEPKVVLLYRDVLGMTHAQYSECWELIESGDLPECDI